MKNNTEIKICDVCKKKYTGFPAISRVNCKKELCPACGAEEAFAIYAAWLKGNNSKKDKEKEKKQ